MTSPHYTERSAPWFPFDFAAYDHSGRRTTIVEAKRRIGTDNRWAAEYWRNLRKNRSMPSADVFALIVPDRLYVWKVSEPPGNPPVEISVREVLAPYFERVGVGPEQIEPMAFESMVSWWLSDLSRHGTSNSELLRSGLPAAVEGTVIVHEARG